MSHHTLPMHRRAVTELVWKVSLTAALCFASTAEAELKTTSGRGNVRAPWDVEVPKSSHVPLGATTAWGSTGTNDMSNEAEVKVLDATADRMEAVLDDSDDPLEKYSMSLWGYANPVDASMHAREVLRQQTQQLRSELPGAYSTCKHLGTPALNCTRALKIRARLRSTLTAVDRIKQLMPEATKIDDDLHHSGDAFTQSFSDEQQVELALKQEAANDKQLWKTMDVENEHSLKYQNTQAWMLEHVDSLTKSVRRSAKKANVAKDRAQSFDVQMRGIVTGVKLTNLLDRKTSGAAVEALRKAQHKEVEADGMAHRASKLIHGTETWLSERRQADKLRKRVAQERTWSQRIQRGAVAQTLSRFGGKLPPRGKLPEERVGQAQVAGKAQNSKDDASREEDPEEAEQAGAADDPNLGTSNDPVVAAALGEDAPPPPPAQLHQQVLEMSNRESFDDLTAQRSARAENEQGESSNFADIPDVPAPPPSSAVAEQFSFDSNAGYNSNEDVPDQASLEAGNDNHIVETAAQHTSTDTGSDYDIEKKVDAVAQRTMDELDALERSGDEDMRDDTLNSSVVMQSLHAGAEVNDTSGTLLSARSSPVDALAPPISPHFLLAHGASPLDHASPNSSGNASRHRSSKGEFPYAERSLTHVVGAARFSPRFLLSHRNASGKLDESVTQAAADAVAATHARIESLANSFKRDRASKAVNANLHEDSSSGSPSFDSRLRPSPPAPTPDVFAPEQAHINIPASIDAAPAALGDAVAPHVPSRAVGTHATEFDAARHVAESSAVLREIVRDTRPPMVKARLKIPAVNSFGTSTNAAPVAPDTRNTDQFDDAAKGAENAADNAAKALAEEASAEDHELVQAEKRLQLLDMDS